MSNQPQDKKLQALKDKWYNTLKESGFEDIEQEDGLLKKWHSSYFIHTYHPDEFGAKQTYYRMAGKFYNDFKFKLKLHKMVWGLHSEGKSFREIARILKRMKITCSKDKAHNIVREHTKIMMTLYGNDS